MTGALCVRANKPHHTSTPHVTPPYPPITHRQHPTPQSHPTRGRRKERDRGSLEQLDGSVTVYAFLLDNTDLM